MKANDLRQRLQGLPLTPLLVVFKGAPNGLVEKKNSPHIHPGMIYTCQSNAWMDERVMYMWIEKVLKPYVENVPIGLVPVLTLDSYRCHMMRPDVNTIEDLGIEVQPIPGGCISLCQPVEVGVNKPFKSRMRRLWEEWMTSRVLNDGKSHTQPGKISRNGAGARLRTYQHRCYFPPPPDHAAAAVVANDTNVNEEEESTAKDNESTDDNESSDDDDHKVGQSEPHLSPARHGKDMNKNEEDIGSGDDDDGEVGQSEPFLSPDYHGDKIANDDVDNANDNVDNANDNVDNAEGGTVNDENNYDDDDLPPALPDTMDLACILQ